MLGSGLYAAVPEKVLEIYNRITLTEPDGQRFQVAAEDDPVFAGKEVQIDEILGNPKGKTPAERATSVVARAPKRTSPNGVISVVQRAWLGSLVSEHLRLTVEVRAAGGSEVSLKRIDYFTDISFPDAEVRMIENRPVICGTGANEWYLYVEDPDVPIRETKAPDGTRLWSAWKADPAVLKAGEPAVFALRAGSGKPKMPPLPAKAGADAKKDS